MNHLYTNQGEYTAVVTVSDGELSSTDQITIIVEQGTVNDNLALNKPATASSIEQGLSVEAVNDGLLSTRWGSEYGATEWIKIDLQQVANINRVILTWERASAESYHIMISNVDSEPNPSSPDWITLSTQTGMPDAARSDDATVSGSGRYIAIYSFNKLHEWGYSIFELEVYGVPDSINQSPVARITANPSSGLALLNVSFDASTSTDDGSIVSYLWNFGDGSSFTGVSANHLYNVAGVYIVTLTVTDNEGAIGTAQTNINVTEETGDLVVEYKEGGYGAADDSQIKPHLRITNNGTSSVALSELTVRYWFTKEGGAGIINYCDWAQIGCSNISSSFGLAKGMDYMELSFSASAGSLTNGSTTGDIQCRMAKSDWSNFDESNDYSYAPTITSYTAHDKVTLYQNGVLVWGIEPGGLKTSTEELALQNDIKFYPNPTKDNLTIMSKESLIGKILRVRDASGRMVYSQKITQNNKQLLVKLKGCKPGVYFLRFEGSNASKSYRFIVE